MEGYFDFLGELIIFIGPTLAALAAGMFLGIYYWDYHKEKKWDAIRERENRLAWDMDRLNKGEDDGS